VSCRYACRHPDRVLRLNLVVPPGLPEPWWMPCHPARKIAKLCTAMGLARLHGRAGSLLRVIQTTPEYGVQPAEVVRLARDHGVRVAVFAAQLDMVHSPHAQFWRAAAAQCASDTPSGNQGEQSVMVPTADALRDGWAGAFDVADDCASGNGALRPLRYVLLRGWSHWGVCKALYELGLHLDESLWHEPVVLKSAGGPGQSDSDQIEGFQHASEPGVMAMGAIVPARALRARL
jgi:pimeloyl-ACP methyl ester carboxylesterase